MFVDCIHVIFCRPLGLVAGFNAICNACLAQSINVVLSLVKHKGIIRTDGER